MGQDHRKVLSTCSQLYAGMSSSIILFCLLMVEEVRREDTDRSTRGIGRITRKRESDGQAGIVTSCQAAHLVFPGA